MDRFTFQSHVKNSVIAEVYTTCCELLSHLHSRNPFAAIRTESARTQEKTSSAVEYTPNFLGYQSLVPVPAIPNVCSLRKSTKQLRNEDRFEK